MQRHQLTRSAVDSISELMSSASWACRVQLWLGDMIRIKSAKHQSLARRGVIAMIPVLNPRRAPAILPGRRARVALTHRIRGAWRATMRRTFARLCVVGVMWIGGGVMAVPAAASVRGAPSIAFTPASQDYGTLSVGQTASQTFVLKNSGGSATVALTVSLSGSVAFTKRADSCTATSLGPNKMCSVTVTYAPTTTGTSDSATLTGPVKKRARLQPRPSPARPKPHLKSCANRTEARSLSPPCPTTCGPVLGGATRPPTISEPRRTRLQVLASRRRKRLQCQRVRRSGQLLLSA